MRFRIPPRDPAPLILEAKQRRVEWAQAVGIALAANLLLVAMLLSIVVEPGKPMEKPLLVATVAPETDRMEEAATSPARTIPAATRPPKSAAERGVIEMKRTTPSLVTAPSLISVPTEAESIAMSDPTALMGQSLSRDDFAAVVEQRTKNVKDFVESKGRARPAKPSAGQGGRGVGTAMLNSIFHGDRLGDGSNAVVFLDVSGSMREISQDVESFMNMKYRNAIVHQVRGCSMKQTRDPFPATLTGTRWPPSRTDFYFVCDLFDGERDYVIDSIKRFLKRGETPRRLHIVSFNRPPGTHLRRLLAETGGTFVYALETGP